MNVSEGKVTGWGALVLTVNIGLFASEKKEVPSKSCGKDSYD